MVARRENLTDTLGSEEAEPERPADSAAAKSVPNPFGFVAQMSQTMLISGGIILAGLGLVMAVLASRWAFPSQSIALVLAFATVLMAFALFATVVWIVQLRFVVAAMRRDGREMEARILAMEQQLQPRDLPSIVANANADATDTADEWQQASAQDEIAQQTAATESENHEHNLGAIGDGGALPTRVAQFGLVKGGLTQAASAADTEAATAAERPNNKNEAGKKEEIGAVSNVPAAEADAKSTAAATVATAKKTEGITTFIAAANDSDDSNESKLLPVSASLVKSQPKSPALTPPKAANTQPGSSSARQEHERLMRSVIDSIKQRRIEYIGRPATSLSTHEPQFGFCGWRLRQANQGVINPQDFDSLPIASDLMPTLDSLLAIAVVSAVRSGSDNANIAKQLSETLVIKVSRHTLVNERKIRGLIASTTARGDKSSIGYCCEMNYADLTAEDGSGYRAADLLADAGLGLAVFLGSGRQDTISTMDTGILADYATKLVRASMSSFQGYVAAQDRRKTTDEDATIGAKLRNVGIELVVDGVNEAELEGLVRAHGVKSILGKLAGENMDLQAEASSRTASIAL